MRRHLPNIITISNLFCGIIGILLVLRGHVIGAVLMTTISLLADFLDGFVARRLQVYSLMGKELDSLADMVSFGVLPGVILLRMTGGLAAGDVWLTEGTLPRIDAFIPALAALQVPLFSAVRLAKFNIDPRQSDQFYGVPTPANTILVISLWMIAVWQPDSWMGEALNQPWLIAGLSILLSYLLIADFPLLALKFRDFSWRNNQYRYLLLGGAVLLLIFFQYMGLPLVFLLYLGLSALATLRSKKET